MGIHDNILATFQNKILERIQRNSMQFTPLREERENPLSLPQKSSRIRVESPPGNVAGAMGTVAVQRGLVPHPAHGAITHLGFQFRDLQVQFIQVLVHESNERLEEKHKPDIEMKTLTLETAPVTQP